MDSGPPFYSPSLSKFLLRRCLILAIRSILKQLNFGPRFALLLERYSRLLKLECPDRQSAPVLKVIRTNGHWMIGEAGSLLPCPFASPTAEPNDQELKALSKLQEAAIKYRYPDTLLWDYYQHRVMYPLPMVEPDEELMIDAL